MQPKQRAAFYDVDNTLLNLKSMFSFQEYFYDNAPSPWRGTQGAYTRFVEQLHTHPASHDRMALNRLFYESYRGRRREDVLALADEWFAELLAKHGDALWITPALELAQRLRSEGYLLVAVSGSSHEILGPVLKHLCFDHCLATTLELNENIYTGRIVPPQVIGDGKGEVIRQFAQSAALDLQDCVACGDHITDLPMLEAVGSAYVIAGDAALEDIAVARNWPVLGASSINLDKQLAHV